jgi:hypothetical protein
VSGSPVTLRFGPRDGDVVQMSDAAHIVETHWAANVPGPDGDWLLGHLEVWQLQYRRTSDPAVAEFSLMQKAGWL